MDGHPFIFIKERKLNVNPIHEAAKNQHKQIDIITNAPIINNERCLFQLLRSFKNHYGYSPGLRMNPSSSGKTGFMFVILID